MTAVALGIDLGTSGVRAALATEQGEPAGSFAARLPASERRDPARIWACVVTALDRLAGRLGSVRAIAVDGTSGSILPIDATGSPVGDLRLYNDAAPAAEVAAVAREMPHDSAAGGATSPLARALALQNGGAARILHEADWIAGMLCGRFDVTDANNALKTGYDPRGDGWPDWIGRTGLRMALLPRVVMPGTPLAMITATMAARFDLSRDAQLMAGTTDGCASFLATGAAAMGDGVTALGTTLTIKLLSDQPIFAPEYGIYSHRLLGAWLPGGASNAGGAGLARFFDAQQLARLSARIDTARSSGLDFYPLPATGERFPINDPTLEPRTEPRPDDDVLFLQGLLEGLAAIEAKGYRLLRTLGAPPVTRVFSLGGGAANAAWTALRAKAIQVPVHAVPEREAAFGTALLALRGLSTQSRHDEIRPGTDASRPA